jgi:hypothetical protein
MASSIWSQHYGSTAAAILALEELKAVVERGGQSHLRTALMTRVG